MNFKIPDWQSIPKSRLNAALVVILVIVAAVIWTAHHERTESSAADGSAEIPTAGVVKVTREDLYKLVTIPAEFRPYVEVELHAKVSGYVNAMYVDFGDTVKAGQLLATLEIPELSNDLDNAQATVRKTEADYTNSDLIYSRLVSVNTDHPNLVAQQDLDTAGATERTTAANLAAARASVEKLRTMLAYTRITAPFDGIVTHRYADPGSLIQAGTSSDVQSMPLVRVSDNYLLRLDFPVTVDYVKDMRVGDIVGIQVESLGDRTFEGTITRFSQHVDETTRTMTTEVEVPNPNLEIVPGMYATVSLKVENQTNALAVPVEAVHGGKTPSISVVSANDEVEERPVTLGVETPDKYQVLSGLQEGELVVIGSHANFQPGQKVNPKLIEISKRDEY